MFRAISSSTVRLLSAAALAATVAGAALATDTERMNVSSSEVQSAVQAFPTSFVSPDGRFVGFRSVSTNIGFDSNGTVADVYVRGFPGDTWGAGTEGSTTCSTTDAAPDVWYHFFASCTGQATIDTVDSSMTRCSRSTPTAPVPKPTRSSAKTTPTRQMATSTPAWPSSSSSARAIRSASRASASTAGSTP